MQIDIGQIYSTAKGLHGEFVFVLPIAFEKVMVESINQHCAKEAKAWKQARQAIIGIKQRCMTSVPEGMVVSIIGPVFGRESEQSVLHPINEKGEALFNQGGKPAWQAV